MTMPDERTRSLIHTERFLLDLLSAQVTPGVPRAIRDRARALLRHHPTTSDLLSLAMAEEAIQSMCPLLDRKTLQSTLDQRRAVTLDGPNSTQGPQSPGPTVG